MSKNKQNLMKEDAFIMAAMNGSSKVMHELIDEVAINYQDKNGNTATHYIALNGDPDLLLLLLEKKADVTVINNDNQTAFGYAVECMIEDGRLYNDDYKNVFILLVSYGAEVNELYAMRNKELDDYQLLVLENVIKTLSDITFSPEEAVFHVKNHLNDETNSPTEDDLSLNTVITELNQSELSTSDSSIVIYNKEDNYSTKKHLNKDDIIQKASVFSELLLQKYLSWINELPEWLQNQILNSSTVKAIIEFIEQNAKIYDKKVDLDIYVQDQFSSEEESLSEVEDSFDPKVTVSEVLESELVDTNMILNGNYVSGLILPTSGEQAINFNGLNFNDFAIF